MPEETSITIPGTKVRVPRKIALLVAAGVVILFVFLQRSGKADTSAGGGEKTKEDTSALETLMNELMDSGQGLETPNEVVEVPRAGKSKNRGSTAPETPPPPSGVDLTDGSPVVVKTVSSAPIGKVVEYISKPGAGGKSVHGNIVTTVPGIRYVTPTSAVQGTGNKSSRTVVAAKVSVTPVRTRPLGEGQ